MLKTLARPRDRDEILRRLRSVRPQGPPRWGRMSAHQMVCHLGDSLRMAMGEKAASDATSPLRRTVLKWVAVYLPLRWPEGVATRPEIDQEGGGTEPVDFDADVARLEALVDDFAALAPRARPPHPVFGPMSAAAWLRWGYRHMDHHLRQFGA